MVPRPYYRSLSEEPILWALQVCLCSYKMKEATMTRPESFDRIQNLQITNQARRDPRMHMRIPVLLLWDENGGERSEQAHT